MAETNRVLGDLTQSLTIAGRDLERLAERLRAARERISTTADDLEVYGAAALISGYSSHLERMFERIVRDMNSAPLEGPDWHRRLLRSMTAERPGIRPAVIDVRLAERLDELLAFRHLFRNLYVLDLRHERVADLLELVCGLHDAVMTSLADFRKFLEALDRNAHQVWQRSRGPDRCRRRGWRHRGLSGWVRNSLGFMGPRKYLP